jgi:hypothetical protein
MPPIILLIHLHSPTVPTGPIVQGSFIWTAINKFEPLNLKHTKKALLASIKRINPHNNNYNRNEAKLSPTHALVQNKPKKPTNTPRVIIDLDLYIYD